MDETLFDTLMFLVGEQEKHGDAYAQRYAAAFRVRMQANKAAVLSGINASGNVPPPGPTAADIAANLARDVTPVIEKSLAGSAIKVVPQPAPPAPAPAPKKP